MIISLFLFASPVKPAKPVTLTPATSIISRSVKIKPGVYTLESKDGVPALRIDADGVVVDFQGATLRSPAARTGLQETYEGVGLGISGRKNVTVRNAKIHGYRFNIQALKCSGLTLENCEIGQSRSQKIMDGDSVNYIWLGLRDLNAWRSYGCSAWLEDCTLSTVRGVRANQCQNGLMLVNSNKNQVVGCDFSYESGWGVSLWNSSDNLICWNLADFVNRPWSGLWGGDSSGFILTTSSHRNIFAYNSLTHGGDGFFLATQSAGMDREGVFRTSGTCDNNVVAYNDGSWSPHNAFESTFSTGNIFYRNWANESDYGFWLGFSGKNIVSENQINGSHSDGIAHGQGSDNWFVNNVIGRTRGAAIRLWSGNDSQSAQVPSARSHIIGNKITKAGSAYALSNSTDYTAARNIVKEAPIPSDFKPGPAGGAPPAPRVPRLAEILKLKPKNFRFYKDTDRPKGWDWLSATKYGMRDYRGMLVPWMVQDSKTIKLAVDSKRIKKIILPDWLVMRSGVKKNERLVTIKPTVKPTGDYKPFEIQVTGTAGERQTIAGRFLNADWNVRWFKWFRQNPDAYYDAEAWKTLFAGPPIKEEKLPALPAIQGYASPTKGVPPYYFAFVATTQIKFEAGTYRFNSLSDDGIRVLVDGKPVIDNWTHHAGTNDTGLVTLTSGLHAIEVNYCQENGAAALAVSWAKESP